MITPDEAHRREKVEEEASLWAGRLAGGELSEEHRRALSDWLRADPEHRRQLAQFMDLSREAEVLMPSLVAGGAVEAPPRRRAGRDVRWWMLGGLGTAAAAAVLAVVLLRAPFPVRFDTEAGSLAQHALADGSQVDLNARTSLEVTFSRSERRVALRRGEACFSVTREADRPFVVTTPAGEVRVTGTRFNVRLAAAETIEVTVLEGSVLVTGPRDGLARKLVPGDQLLLRAGEPDLRRMPLESLQDAVAWLQGRVVFENTSLQEAARRFAEHTGRPVVVAREVAEVRIGGAFRIDDLEGFAKAVEQMQPRVKASRDAAGNLHFLAR